MSNYFEIDPIIERSASSVGASIVREWADAPARFFYLPGDPPFECFQVSVDAPENGRVSVYARAVDTNDDTENAMGRAWTGPVAELEVMLGAAIATVGAWKVRERGLSQPGLGRDR
jgi:hypothetical protein